MSICQGCGEDWSAYHLRHEAVHETGAGRQILDDILDAEEAKKSGMEWLWLAKYSGEKWVGRLTPFWREEFKRIEFEFRESVYDLVKCPCCAINKRDGNDSERKPVDVESIAINNLLDRGDADDYGVAYGVAGLGDW